MILDKSNADTLYIEYKDEFTKFIEKILKLERKHNPDKGCSNIDEFCLKSGITEFQLFVDWYNGWKDGVDEEYYIDVLGDKRFGYLNKELPLDFGFGL